MTKPLLISLKIMVLVIYQKRQLQINIKMGDIFHILLNYGYPKIIPFYTIEYLKCTPITEG